MTTHEIIDSYNFSHKFRRLYIVALGRDMLFWGERPNQKLHNILNVAELYTTGTISDDKLLEAHNDVPRFEIDGNNHRIAQVCRCAAWLDVFMKAAAHQASTYHNNPRLILLSQINKLSELEKIIMNIPKDLKY